MPEEGGPSGPEAEEASGAMSETENEYDETEHHSKDEDDKMSDHNTATEGVEVKKKYDPKDPLRPRRKKARRACYACQRAHLTCGDERPCQRCIKRGLMDTCQDGVRKKAKYLHDAPPEALRPVLGPNYNPNAHSARHGGHRHPSISVSDASTVGTFFTQSNTSQFPMFSSTQSLPATLAEAMPFGSQQSPVSPTFQTSSNPPMSGIGAPPVTSPMTTNFAGMPFDPSDPNIFNFNLEGLNFGSQYGALEFGMLGHMSSGAAETPPHDSLGHDGLSRQGEVNYGPGVFGNGVNPFEKPLDSRIISELIGLDHHSNIYTHGNLQHGLPHAYAIAAGPQSLQSPSTENNSPQPTTFGFDERSPTMATYSGPPANTNSNRSSKQPNALTKLGHSSLGKRQRDPSYVYDTVKKSFDYVGSFHKLFEVVKGFSQPNTARIAKALASIRPSFIASTKSLTPQDLIFMEKYFQRTLIEYEGFMEQSSSPAFVCRRTGEIAGANKEFTALTGWTKDVLLGKEPNRNTNLGGPVNKRGSATPHLKSINETSTATSDGPQPVFLAELMDHDSVVEFYEDYSQLAFNDSRGKMTRKCRLLKYRTDKSADAASESHSNNNNSGSVTSDQSPQKDPRNSYLSNRVAKIDGEHGISKLEKDGKLECSYTWTIKRDMFDMPMLFVINFLPCYYRTHNQLAV
ncbi:putative transcription factor [Podospora fimiseda]|uniref:Transcription factor n=1 Tax=Podospora fimiseda TaxID=252190 RepID=A0AAN7H2W4_9PEZI|nr:putative transcription factor [Podospora fimiseda]